jgi:hypothetical protein
MPSATEALKLDIAIARLASEYAAAVDPGRKSQLLSSIESLRDRRDRAAAGHVAERRPTDPFEASLATAQRWRQPHQ